MNNPSNSSEEPPNNASMKKIKKEIDDSINELIKNNDIKQIFDMKNELNKNKNTTYEIDIKKNNILNEDDSITKVLKAISITDNNNNAPVLKKIINNENYVDSLKTAKNDFEKLNNSIQDTVTKITSKIKLYTELNAKINFVSRGLNIGYINGINNKIGILTNLGKEISKALLEVNYYLREYYKRAGKQNKQHIFNYVKFLLFYEVAKKIVKSPNDSDETVKYIRYYIKIANAKTRVFDFESKIEDNSFIKDVIIYKIKYNESEINIFTNYLDRLNLPKIENIVDITENNHIMSLYLNDVYLNDIFLNINKKKINEYTVDINNNIQQYNAEYNKPEIVVARNTIAALNEIVEDKEGVINKLNELINKNIYDLYYKETYRLFYPFIKLYHKYLYFIDKWNKDIKDKKVTDNEYKQYLIDEYCYNDQNNYEQKWLYADELVNKGGEVNNDYGRPTESPVYDSYNVNCNENTLSLKYSDLRSLAEKIYNKCVSEIYKYNNHTNKPHLENEAFVKIKQEYEDSGIVKKALVSTGVPQYQKIKEIHEDFIKLLDETNNWFHQYMPNWYKNQLNESNNKSNRGGKRTRKLRRNKYSKKMCPRRLHPSRKGRRHSKRK